jgi:endonuclease/exonuclease/phosphatase family metal-dependent hydrolase
VRLIFYNIRYGTGGKYKQKPWSGYLGFTHVNLEQISNFIKDNKPDVVGLVEVDLGSYRSKGKNQAEEIAEMMEHYHTFKTKYADSSIMHKFPVLNKQGNAFISKDSKQNEQFHFFDKGMKRLVIELECDGVSIWLVHLALSFKARHLQLSTLYSMLEKRRKENKPVIVMGDFNIFLGVKELNLFLQATGLKNPCAENDILTYPSWRPKRQLDFILHTEDITVTNIQAEQVIFSDHLPLICDIEVKKALPLVVGDK